MILHAYLARRFLWTFGLMFIVFAVLLGLIDLVDELQDTPDLPFANVLEVVLLKLPEANYEILPLVLILASIALFLRLARSSELVVLRASGRSALTGLLGPLVIVALIGLIGLTVINPLIAASSKRYNDINIRNAGGNTSILAISGEGLWLRQGSAIGQTVIHAQNASSDVSSLYDVTFISFDSSGTPLRRIMAEEARLQPGEWLLTNAKSWILSRSGNPENTAQNFADLRIPSPLTRDRIIDSIGKPEYIPVWDLPDFIAELEDSGFSARRYEMWYQMELARPLFLIALMIISAAFSMRHSRLADTGVAVLLALLLGFTLHYIRNFSQVLGDNGQIPILLAAWAPPLASLFLGLGLFLHLEDG